MITRQIVLDSFDTVRGNTIEIAKDIPEEQYGFRASDKEGVPTVSELLKKIITFTEFMSELAILKTQPDFKTEGRDAVFKRLCATDLSKVNTKAEIIKALEASAAGIRKKIEAQNEAFLNESFVAPDGITKVRLWVVNCAKEQEMTMRSQLFLYERILGIVPHTTRKQLEREAKEKAAAGK